MYVQGRPKLEVKRENNWGTKDGEKKRKMIRHREKNEN
jgi:hypothetical protein